MLLGTVLIVGVYLATGCSVAAGSWDSVQRRTPVFPETAYRVVRMALVEVVRWPLTVVGK